jgi:hypothetical protein
LTVAVSIASKGRLFSRPFVLTIFKAMRLARIHKTNPMEPEISGNIAHLLSLSARAMQTNANI